MAGLHANKAVFCEWPLGATLAEAQEMATFAKARGLKTIVSLQARSDPTLMYARDLIHAGYIGDVLTANLSVVSQQALERGAGRIWQGDRTNGANTLTIAGGHAIDGLCYVLGEFDALAARLATRIKAWKSTETGQDVPVDAPDTISVAGVLQFGAEVSVHVTAIPFHPSGTRLEIYGRAGTMVIEAPRAFNIGPNVLYAAQGNAPLAEMLGPGPETISSFPGRATRTAAQRRPGLQARGTRLRCGHGIRSGHYRPHLAAPHSVEHRPLGRGPCRAELRPGQAASTTCAPTWPTTTSTWCASMWDSWEPHAVVPDRETGVYVNRTQVHTVEFTRALRPESRPMNTVRPPPGRPVFVPGRRFTPRPSVRRQSTPTRSSPWRQPSRHEGVPR